MVEVLVAGAGPAGAVAATLLARAGVRVLLVDRCRFPRDKLCGDSVNPGVLAALARLGLRDAVGNGRPIDGMLVTSRSGIAVRGRYRRGWQGRSIRRRHLDAALVAAAARAGVRLEEEVEVRAPWIESGVAGPVVLGAVLESRNGRSRRQPARVIIAADGRRSRLALALGLIAHPMQPRRWAAGTYVEGVAGLSEFGEMHVRPGHYIGVAPMPDGLANTCLVTADRRGFADPTRLLETTVAADPVLGPRFAQARVVRPATTLGPLAVEARAAGVPGLLLAGDAAGFVDPMTGDGLRFAIRGAELAVQVALEMLETGRQDGYRVLARRRRVTFGPKWQFNRALRALVGSEAGLEVAVGLGSLAPGLVRWLIGVAGDVPGALHGRARL